jgi:AcrR family transcriptional regulator
MRDLASAAGLNVASLYHYFPSKRDLLESVLSDRGFLPVRARQPGRDEHHRVVEKLESPLAQLLADILMSMFEVEDFVRLMVGEAIRGDETARAVGFDLFSSFHASIEGWITTNRPDLAENAGAPEIARLLSAMVVGLFIEHAAGVLRDEGDDMVAVALQRAQEADRIFRPQA